MAKESDQITRRRFLQTASATGVMVWPGFCASERHVSRKGEGGRWRLPLRITERAGVRWQGEGVSLGIAIPPSCKAIALRLKDERSDEVISFGAGYAGRTSTGSLRWCQLFIPLHLGPGGQENLIVDLLEDGGEAGAVIPVEIESNTLESLDLGNRAVGIRWEFDSRLGVRAAPTIKGQPTSGAEWDWGHIAIADLSAPKAMVGGYLPLEGKEKATLYRRVMTPHGAVVDLQRTLVRGAYGAGYELRQIQQYDLPAGQQGDERPYALCDLILFVHAGRDGVPLKVDGMGFLLGSNLQKEYVWQPRGDAGNPEERRRGSWQEGLRLPPGDWMLTKGERGQSQLVIPWSSYAMDGYDLSYLVGQTHTVPANSSAKHGLSVALARRPYNINVGTGGSWGRSTYEFRCRLAWGAINESVAERLSRAYRRPPHVEVGEPEQVRNSLALRCWPEHFTYAPGDTVRVDIEATAEAGGRLPPSGAANAEVLIHHRGKPVGEPTRVQLIGRSGHEMRGEFNWTAPEAAGGGYVLTARLAQRKEAIEAPPVTVEVLRRPQDLSWAVRMATVCEIYPDRDANVLADRLVDARINVVWMRNAFHFGQYTGPVGGSWEGAEGCQMGDIDRPVRVHGGHLRRFIQACHARGITTIVYGNVRNLQESSYAAAVAAGALTPEDVDLSDRRWPFPQDQVNYRALAESPRWQQYLIDQITDGYRRLGYDGYFFDNTSFAAKQPEAEMAHNILKATRLARPDQFTMENPGPPPTPKVPDGWRNPRDPEIIRWPEVGCALMEKEEINSPEGIIAYARFYRKVDDNKTPVMFMNDPTRRSPAAHLLRVGHLLAGKATDDLCVGNSTHDGAVFFEQCPVSAALTRKFYEALGANSELFEPGPLLQGVNVSGLESASVLAYDGLAAGRQARTVIIANRAGWNAPLRNVGYYWDGPKPSVRPARDVVVTLPAPAGRPIEGCWLVRPEGWAGVDWKLASTNDAVTVHLGEVSEVAAVVMRWKG